MIIRPLSLYFSVSWKSNSWRIAIVLVWVRANVWNISSSSSSTRFFYFVYFYTTYDWLEIVPKRTFAYSYSSYLGVISFYNYCNFWSISFNLFFKCISYYCSRGGYILPQSIYNAVGIKPYQFSEYFPLHHKYPSIP